MGHVNIIILIFQKNFYDRAIIEASLQKCNVLKLNDEVLEAELEWHKDQSPKAQWAIRLAAKCDGKWGIETKFYSLGP